MATAPGFVFTLLGGVFADLIDRRRLLLYTQVVAGIAALALAALVATDVVNRWMVLGFSFVTGCCMALASPSYLAMTYDLVGREDLANAIAMNSTQFQLSRVVGPALAGVAFRLFGLAGCFFANGLSFVAVVVALWMVRFEHHVSSAAHSVRIGEPCGAIWSKAFVTFATARECRRCCCSRQSTVFLARLTSVWCRSMRATSFNSAKRVSRLMMGTAGAGAFLGALLVAYLGDFKRKGWFVLGGAILFGLCITGFALSSRLDFRLSCFSFGSGICAGGFSCDSRTRCCKSSSRIRCVAA